MAVWNNIKFNKKFAVLRFMQFIPAWGIIVLLFVFHDGDCLSWKHPHTAKAYCREWVNDTLAYYNWIGPYNVYPEIRGQVFVVCAAIFCALASLGLLLLTIKCGQSNDEARAIPLQSTNEPSTYVVHQVPASGVRNFFASPGPQHSKLVKFILIFCTLLMLAAGPLETWYALGFGRRVDIPIFLGSRAQWFGNWPVSALLCFVLAILYIIDFVLGMRGEANPHLQVTDYR